jgi:hypothetical protein
MRSSNWVWLAGAFVALPAVVATIAFVDASLELGKLHSTWQTGAVLLGAVAIGVYLLWQLDMGTSLSE